MLNSFIKYALIIAFSFAFFVGNAQGLTKGALVPDLEIDHVLNSSNGKIKLSQFRDRLILLDFWSFKCLSCLQSFPHMDSMQQKFADKIQIIFVNQESKEETENLFEKREKLHRPLSPMITGDSVLNRLFPHQGNPYHVWIDKNGKVLYLTESFYATEKNIMKVLKGNDISLPNRIYRSSAEPFGSERVADKTAYYSIITRYDPKIVLALPSQKDHRRLVYETLSPLSLYQAVMDSLTHNQYEFSRVGRTILDLSDPENYVRPSDPELIENWYAANAYNYQLLWPKERNGEMFKIMKEDLDRYFSLDVSIEKRRIKCLALIRLTNEDLLKTKGGRPIFNLLQTDLRTPYDSVRYITNLPFFALFRNLRDFAERKYNMPVVDQTGYEGNIDFKIPADLLDYMELPALRNVLNKYGLDLFPVNCELTVLVVRHK